MLRAEFMRRVHLNPELESRARIDVSKVFHVYPFINFFKHDHGHDYEQS